MTRAIVWFAVLASGAGAQAQTCCRDGTPLPWASYNRGVRWAPSLEKAQTVARAARKPILLFLLSGDLDKQGCAAPAHLMRSVTFTDPAVAAEANANFVPAWINVAPGFHRCGDREDRRVFDHAQEAFAAGSLCTFFLTADLEVAHYVPGYAAPDLFRGAMRFALDLRDRSWPTLRKAHAAAADRVRKEADRIAQASRNGRWQAALKAYGAFRFGERHRHGARCLHHLQEALECWADAHAQLAAFEAMPPFPALRDAYLYRTDCAADPADAREEADLVPGLLFDLLPRRSPRAAAPDPMRGG